MAAAKDRAKLEKAVARAEARIFALKEQLVELRRKLPVERVQDYVFQGHDGKALKLSQAFRGKPDLIVVHNMGRACPYCTLWADEYNGVVAHLEDRAAFLVTSPDDVKTQKEFYRSRGWKFRMASVRGTTFAHDMGFEPEPGRFRPGFSTFRKGKGGRIERVSKAFFGPGDDFCGVWHFFALLSGGVAGWGPKFRY